MSTDARRQNAMDQLRLIARTPHYVVLDKPAGVLSVPGKAAENQRSVISWLRGVFPAASGPIVVHRLDMDTSGVMVYALDQATQRALSWSFESRRVGKGYVALVHDTLAHESGTIDEPIRADIKRRPYQIVDHLQGRVALTHWRVLAYEVDRTRVALTPHTGRTHQLRVHMAHIGHPIIGDVLYGQPEVEPAPRLMLHAQWLEFPDPSTGGLVRFASPVPF